MKRIIFIYLFLTNFIIIGQNVEILHKQLNDFHQVRDFCISANEKEVYFTVQSFNQEISQILCVKNGQWQKPEILPFCDQFSYLEPFISHDEKRLYFASNRPKNDTLKTKSDFDIWYVERKNIKSKWSKPINLGSQVNSENDEFYPSLADNNNLYFTMEAKSGMGKDDIYCCIWDGKSYQKPVLLNSNINSDGYEFNAFIAKDESFLIYTKYGTKDGFGSGDLYMARKDADGNWKEAVNMGAVINTKFMEYCPFYDSKNHVLYFTSKRNNLISQKFSTTSDLQKYLSHGENGLSKIYKIKIIL